MIDSSISYFVYSNSNQLIYSHSDEVSELPADILAYFATNTVSTMSEKRVINNVEYSIVSTIVHDAYLVIFLMSEA